MNLQTIIHLFTSNRPSEFDINDGWGSFCVVVHVKVLSNKLLVTLQSHDGIFDHKTTKIRKV